MNLFIFPFAGGSSYSFDFIKKYISHKIYVVGYPGRGNKMHQELIDDADVLVNRLYDELKGLLNTPYCFYGHSMGTLISFLLIKKIQQNNLLLPTHLFVSGRGAPSAPLDDIRYNLPKNEFWQKIKDLGGSPEEIFTNQDLMDFFEPALRADIKAIETYQYQPSEPFNFPISVLLGTDDKVTHEEAILWQKETTLPIKIHYFDGEHFFIFDHSKEIAELIMSGNNIQNA